MPDATAGSLPARSNRLALLLGFLLVAGAATAVILAIVMRSAMTPVIRVSSRAGKSPGNPAEEAVRKKIEAQYTRLMSILSKPNPAGLPAITTHDFIMERLFRDRISNYTLQDWQTTLGRYGAVAPPWPMTASTSGVQFTRRSRYEAKIERLTVQGDKADVLASITMTFGGGRYPPRTAFTAIQELRELDTWVRIDKEWKLNRIRMSKVKWTRESTREGL